MENFRKGRKPPLDLLKEWIDESYRAQAPKKFVEMLPAREKHREAAIV